MPTGQRRLARMPDTLIVWVVMCGRVRRTASRSGVVLPAFSSASGGGDAEAGARTEAQSGQRFAGQGSDSLVGRWLVPKSLASSRSRRARDG